MCDFRDPHGSNKMVPTGKKKTIPTIYIEIINVCFRNRLNFLQNFIEISKQK